MGVNMLKWLKKGGMELIPKRTKETDISNEVARGKLFKKRLLVCVEEAVAEFLDGNSLNDVVADIAKRERFNRLQLQRFIEETNTVAFNKRYDLVRNQQDRRISFDLAELTTVLENMGDAAPPEIDNPNLIKGKIGDGEIAKVAHTKMHSPASSIENARARMLAKQAAAEKEELERYVKTTSRNIESNLFKVAQAIVLSHHYYGNGNQIFNTLLEKVAFDEVMIDGITKKADTLIHHLKDTKRLPSRYNLNLTVNPLEKVASTLFGSHSLQKEAAEYTATPKVSPIQNVKDFEDLFDMAMRIKDSQERVFDAEKQLHGGVEK